MRRRLVGGAWAVGVLVVAVTGWWAYDRATEADRCDAYQAEVAGAPIVEWDGGGTATGPAWINVLTDGVENADDAIRAELGRAVAADDDGYDALRDALPAASRPVADRQRARLVDPASAETRRADPAAMADVAHLHRLAAQECSLV